VVSGLRGPALDGVPDPVQPSACPVDRRRREARRRSTGGTAVSEAVLRRD